MQQATPSSISRTDLHRRLVRAAMLRSLAAMGSVVPALLLAALLPEPWRPEWIGLVVFFAVPLLVSWIATVFVCRPMVRCPHCQGSLWSCGTGNFKPRRMKIKSDVNQCPHCGTAFV